MGSECTCTVYGKVAQHFTGKKLKHLCAEKIGIQTGPFGSQLHKDDYVANGTPIITVEHLAGNRISHKNLPMVSDKDKVRLSRYHLQSGDIVFSRVGSVDRNALVSSAEEGWLFSGRCLRVRVDQSKLWPKYLSCFLSLNGVKEHIRSIAVGATMPSINTKILSDLVIYSPPLPEQKAIAHVLGSLDKKIELNRRMNATLEAMAQALFKSWFVDFDPVIDNALVAGNPIPEELTERAIIRRKALADGSANRETAKNFPSSFQFTEEMSWIPEGWEAVAVNQAIKINPPVKLSNGTVAPFADMKALPTAGYTINGVIEKAYSGGARFNNSDVLLARITPCLENGKTGIVDFLSSSTDVGFGSTEFIVLRGQGELKLPYVACLARENSFRLHCMQSMVGSSGRQRVQNSCFENFHIACPIDLTLLKQFSEIAQPIFQKCSDQAKETHILSNLRDILLPQLISGELRICHETERLDKEILI